jgi:tetratricopeptide (TPR) repeat protein
MIRGRTLAETFVAVDNGRDVYSAASAAIPKAALLLQQWAIFESTHQDGSLERAEELAAEARVLDSRNRTIIHTQAEIARKRANKVQPAVLKEQLRRQARERLGEMRATGDRFVMATRCKLLVDEIRELAGGLDENAEPREVAFFSDKVRDAEKTLTNATQQHPDDAEFLEIEANFRDALDQTDRALQALERAWAAGPRGAGVAIRLARAYVRRGDKGKALGFLESALDRDPQDKAIHLEMAMHLLSGNTDDMKRAGEHLARSYAKGDHNHEARHSHAQYLFLIGDLKGASDLFAAIDIGAPKGFRLHAPKQDSPISGRLGRLSRRINKKGGSFAFIRSLAYVDDIYAPEFLTDGGVWDELQANNEVNFRIRFNRAGPVAIDLRMGRVNSGG